MQEFEQREEFPTFYPYKDFLYVAHSLRALEVRWRYVRYDRGALAVRPRSVWRSSSTLLKRYAYVLGSLMLIRTYL